MKELLILFIRSMFGTRNGYLETTTATVTAMGVGTGPNIEGGIEFTVIKICIIIFYGVLGAFGAFLFKVIISVLSKKIKFLKNITQND